MSQEQSVFDVDTLKTDDLCSNRSGLETLRRRTVSIDTRIKRLVLENDALRHQLRIFQETHSLRSASVVATLLTWIDENCPGEPFEFSRLIGYCQYNTYPSAMSIQRHVPNKKLTGAVYKNVPWALPDTGRTGPHRIYHPEYKLSFPFIS